MTVIITFTVLVGSVCCAFCLMSFKAKPGGKGESTVTFYKVPLVCSAAPEIGCGSKAKPVLKQLEKNSSVAEAWLNHTGTVIAVVWKANNNRAVGEKNTMAVFKGQNLDVQMVTGKEYDAMLNDFIDKKNWLRYAEVDKLSMIEAGEIGSRIVARVNAKTPLSNETSSSLKTDFETLFKRWFIKMDTTDVNKDPNLIDTFRQQTEHDLLSIGKKYLDAGQMNALQAAITLGLQPAEGETGYAKDGCCSKSDDTKQKCEPDKDEKKGCCSKTSAN
ncbi:hypothetical protein J3L21_02085 [Mucilaginibacter rubeus]|nr:hypothetical protein [Mucilaginibacter rubeus]QTE44196.1 hypothetical protein J3L19_02100 [Mucilaginibacter rubeus]QTE50797.1 hypothetical protein J3L21_02085 [Mucilaginibacter rubeus]QTE55880.1 hypothetical protein J3L23_27320 [Mucilaginibacter rubeus]QTF63416.1 hypothetical protein J3L20_06190 [Mucilaginibacter rubeus]